MRIDQIDLLNYRQYKGNHIIKFIDDNEKNFNIVLGVNGAGKTNIMNAVNWCLYGIEEHLDKYSVNKQQPIINDSIYNNMKDGQVQECKVKITINDDSDNKLIFERLISIYQKDGVKYVDDKKGVFYGFYEINKDMKAIEHPSIMLNRILPYGVKDFFFFDGEKLDSYFSREKSSEIEAAILNVSQLSLLTKTIAHQEKIRIDLRKQLSFNISPRITELNGKIEQTEKLKEKAEKSLNKYEKDLKEIRSELDTININLLNSNKNLIQQLQKERQDEENNIKIYRKNIDDNYDIVKNNIISYGPQIYSINAIYKTLQILENQTDLGELPPKIRDTFIKELLENGKCICGSDISQNNENRRKVANLLTKVVLSEISDELTEIKFNLNHLNSDITTFTENQNNTRKLISENKANIKKSEKNIEEFVTQLKQYGDVDVVQLEIRRKELKTNEESLIKDIAIEQENKRGYIREIENRNRELTNELEKDRANNKIKNKIVLTSNLITTLRKIHDKLITEIRNNVESKTQMYFLNLIWKKNTYKKIIINQNYDISVLNKENSECLGSLSAGERLVLALSFLAALRDVSGFNAPILIDTPLGRVSGAPRENIAKLLPDFLKNIQVTMLVTDTEYTDSFREKILSKVASEYELYFDEDKGQTTVIPYGKSK